MLHVTILYILDIFDTGVSNYLFVKLSRLLIQIYLLSYSKAVEYDIFFLKSCHIHIVIFFIFFILIYGGASGIVNGECVNFGLIALLLFVFFSNIFTW
jgi:hypothetical protein